MNTQVFDLVLGLKDGAVIAFLALGLVIFYRCSGVVNFATGAMALLSAETYAGLRRGELFVPIPGLPRQVSVGGKDLGLTLSIVICVALTAILGLLVYVLIFRQLRRATPVTKAVASVGVLVVLQSAIVNQAGTNAPVVQPFLPSGSYMIGVTPIQKQAVWVAVIVLAVGFVLWAGYRFTSFGLATRAAAETERGALVTGLSPERIALVNWGIGGAVTGLGGVFISTFNHPVIDYTLLIVSALAAALVANFSGLLLGVVAGIVIGAVQYDLDSVKISHAWLPQSGLRELVPLALIIVYLVIRGRPLPSRGAIVQDSLGRAPLGRHPVPYAIALAALGLLGLFVTHGDIRAGVVTSFIFTLIALSLVIVTGYAGQISLAQLTLAGVGAFALSRLTTTFGVPFPLAPILAALVAAIIGIVVGLPALRIRGLPVAIVTLSLAAAIDQLWFNNSKYAITDVASANSPIVAPRVFGVDFSAGVGHNRTAFAVLCLVVVVVVALATALLRGSRLGSAMLAVRANERSAAAAGVNVARTKIIAFGLAAFVAGLGGSLYGYQIGDAEPTAFAPVLGLALFAGFYLAGVTSVAGGVLGGVLTAGGLGGLLYVAVGHLNNNVGTIYQLLSGIVLVVVVIVFPEGLVGVGHLVADRIRHRDRAVPSAPLAVPSGAARIAHATIDATTGDTRDTVLSVDGLSVHYGGVIAIDGVSFAVEQHSIVGLIGPNGAGKTTLIDAICGFATATGGVDFAGQQLSGHKPHQRVRAGLGRTFQGIDLYDDLSVEENVRVGEIAARSRSNSAHARPQLDELLERLHLGTVRDRPVRELSQGQRQLVSIARALAGDPLVLLLDEPAAGLDSTESIWLAQRLRDVRDAGTTIVIVDHDMGLVLSLCDRVIVLDLGTVIADGTPETIQSDPVVTAAYLGSTHDTLEVAR